MIHCTGLFVHSATYFITLLSKCLSSNFEKTSVFSNQLDVFLKNQLMMCVMCVCACTHVCELQISPVSATDRVSTHTNTTLL